MLTIYKKEKSSEKRRNGVLNFWKNADFFFSRGIDVFQSNCKNSGLNLKKSEIFFLTK